MGIARAPLQSWASSGQPLQGTFAVVHPTSKQPAGQLQLAVRWYDPLSQDERLHPYRPARQQGGVLGAQEGDAQSLTSAVTEGKCSCSVTCNESVPAACLQNIGAPLQATAQALPASPSQSTARWRRCCRGSTVRRLCRSRRMHQR